MQQRLSNKIAKILALGAGVVVLILLGLSYYYACYTSDYLVKDKIAFVAKNTVASISTPLWNLDFDDVRANLTSVLSDTDIVRIELQDEGHEKIVITKADASKENLASSKSMVDMHFDNSLTREVVYGEGAGKRVIGSLTIFYKNVMAEQIRREALRAMLIAGVFLSTALIGFIMHVTRRALLPIEQLAFFLREDLPPDVNWDAPETTSYEVQMLVDAVKIKQAQNLAHGEAIERQMNELRSARISAEKSAQAKVEFLSNMSHELRTPMHAILNYCSMTLKKLHREKFEDEKIFRYQHNIQTSGNRLLGLINNLLDLSKMESGKLEYHFVKDDFSKVVMQSYDELQSLFTKNAVKFKVNEADTKVLACFDAYRMMQVLVNILSNALRYAPEKSTITVNVSEPDIIAIDGVEMIQVSIMDEGLGIPEGELHAIFDKFIQSSKTESKAGGTGLGLSICKQIVEAHRGRIWAENRTEGHGAVFHFTLPKECLVEPTIEYGIGETCEVFLQGS
jgi:signal transduction histidine kinase